MEKMKDVSITDITNMAVESEISHSYKVNTIAIHKACETIIFNKYYLGIQIRELIKLSNFYAQINVSWKLFGVITIIT